MQGSIGMGPRFAAVRPLEYVFDKDVHAEYLNGHDMKVKNQLKAYARNQVKELKDAIVLREPEEGRYEPDPLLALPGIAEFALTGKDKILYQAQLPTRLAPIDAEYALKIKENEAMGAVKDLSVHFAKTKLAREFFAELDAKNPIKVPVHKAHLQEVKINNMPRILQYLMRLGS